MELPCCCRRRPRRRGARVTERIPSRRWRTRAAEVQPQILCNRQIEPVAVGGGDNRGQDGVVVPFQNHITMSAPSPSSFSG